MGLNSSWFSGGGLRGIAKNVHKLSERMGKFKKNGGSRVAYLREGNMKALV